MMVLRRTGMLFLLSSLILTSRGVAQQSTDTAQKMDTTVEDTIVVGAKAGTSAASGSDIDTSNLVGSDAADRDIVSLRIVPDSVVDGYKKNPRYAYANDPAYWRRHPRENSDFMDWVVKVLSSAAFLWCVYILLGGLLLFVIIRIITDNNLGAFYRKRGRISGRKEDTEEELPQEDIEERLQHYLGIGDHRQAVRYLYLRSLRGLNDRGLIQRTVEATNHDYLRQLGGKPQERPFRFLTTAYEKVWYGEFPLAEEPFQRLYRYFVDFDKTIVLIALPVLLFLSSCGSGLGGGKALNRRMSLSHRDDIPYGAKVAYESLPQIFPDAEITINSNNSPLTLSNSSGSNRAFIVIGASFVADTSDVNILMSFIEQGNQVFISANHISESLLKVVSIRATNYQSYAEEPDSLTVGVYAPVDTGYLSFSYPGDSYDNFITRLDTQYTSVLGRDGHGHPNFVRLTYKGGGAIYLHFAPLAFSNFFLLHKQNMAYYDNALSYLSPGTRSVIWDEYFRYEHGGDDFSALRYIFSSKALTWAFWLLLLLFAIIYIFDSRRRQRQIPVIPPLANTSLDFVRTIGRLYFQRRDNHNLATKMVTHFLDQVRTRFHLPATSLDEAFVDKLAYRTGYPKQSLTSLVDYMQALPLKAYISDQELLDFHRQLDAFYKHT